MNINNTLTVKQYIKKYHKDFYGQPDIKYPKREYELKLGIPRCYDKRKLEITRN
jgi:hypothetical protein